MIVIKEPGEFDWDKGNIGKNKKHDVDEKESEEAFFDKKRVIYNDSLHSYVEKRYILIGKTKNRRLLYIVFTYRNRKRKIRIISARDVNKKEVKFYEKET